MGAENIGYLMGKAPSKDIIKKIKYTARKIKGVTGINDIRAHYVGNIVHIEVHVEVDKDISTQASHKICKDVQNAVEKIKSIDRAFIHIDPR
jgi:divalent metal cation (Fe/Co/Zn/Cd) transporter